MKRLILNPMSIVFLIFATILIGSNICCTGNAANKDKSNSSGTDKTTAATTSSDGVLTLTDNNFDTKISTGVVLVDFWATWCRPCRLQGPVIEEVGKEMTGKVTIGKLDIDASPDIASRFGVESIPTMIIFKDGKVVQQFVGLTEKADIISALNKQIK